MGQILHRSTATTQMIRISIQRSEPSAKDFSQTGGINPKTVLKWRSRSTVAYRKTAPRELRSIDLNSEDETMIVALQRHRPLSPGDRLEARQPTILNFKRSPLHRCLQRHGIRRLPDVEGDKFAGLRACEGKLQEFVAIDRTSRFACVKPEEQATSMTARNLLAALIEVVPRCSYKILTDNGIQIATLPKRHTGATVHFFGRPSDNRSYGHESQYLQTRPKHPKNQRQVKRLNPAIWNAIVQRFPLCGSELLRRHLWNFTDPKNSYEGSKRKKMPHAIRVHLQMRDFGTRPFRHRATPSDAETEHPGSKGAFLPLHREAYQAGLFSGLSNIGPGVSASPSGHSFPNHGERMAPGPAGRTRPRGSSMARQ